MTFRQNYRGLERDQATIVAKQLQDRNDDSCFGSKSCNLTEEMATQVDSVRQREHRRLELAVYRDHRIERSELGYK